MNVYIKRSLSILFAMILICISLIPSFAAETASGETSAETESEVGTNEIWLRSEYKYNINDVTLIQMHTARYGKDRINRIAQYTNGKGLVSYIHNVNLDKKIDVKDATLLQKHLAKLVDVAKLDENTEQMENIKFSYSFLRTNLSKPATIGILACIMQECNFLSKYYDQPYNDGGFECAGICGWTDQYARAMMTECPGYGGKDSLKEQLIYLYKTLLNDGAESDKYYPCKKGTLDELNSIDNNSSSVHGGQDAARIFFNDYIRGIDYNGKVEIINDNINYILKLVS